MSSGLMLFLAEAGSAGLGDGQLTLEEGEMIMELSALWESITTSVTSFAGIIGDMFGEVIQNPVAQVTLGVSIGFAAIKGVRKVVKSLRGVH